MALRAVFDHPKLYNLKKCLNAPSKAHGFGFLEAIWHFTGKFTPQGNIGKYNDETLEAWVDWPGEPGALIAALVKSGWIDRDEEFRLLVHDWDEGCDEATKKSLARKKPPLRLIGNIRKFPNGDPSDRVVDAPHAPPDPRFFKFEHLLRNWWAEVNKKLPSEAPWGSGTTRALVEALKLEPELKEQDLCDRLAYRLQAIRIAEGRGRPERGDVNATAFLHEVIVSLPKFANGPVNQFGDKIA